MSYRRRVNCYASVGAGGGMEKGQGNGFVGDEYAPSASW
jgi:hypothetical protein